MSGSEYAHGLLAAALTDPAILTTLEAKPEWFTSDQAFYRALVACQDKGIEPDPIALSDRFREQGMTEAAAAVLAVSISPASTANAGYYAEKLAQQTRRREIRKNAEALLEQLDAGASIETLEGLTRAVVTAPTIRKGGFRFLRVDSMDVTAPDWQVQGLFSVNSLTVIHGAFSSLKSFIIQDVGFCIPSGLDWHGHRVKRGVVVFVNGEGLAGFNLRKRAFELARGVSLDGCPLYISSMAARLGDPEFFPELEAALAEVAEIEGRIDLVVVDTWSRSLEGDENNTADTVAGIAALDRARAPWQASAVVIHHEGWQATGRTRGNSALMSAADYAYGTVRAPDGSVTMTCKKIKDGAPMDPIAFRLVDYDLGILDADGLPVKSAALERIECATKQTAQPIGVNQKVALDVLRDLTAAQRKNLVNAGLDPSTVRVSIADWRSALKALDIDRRRFAEIKPILLELGLIEIDGDSVRTTRQASESGGISYPPDADGRVNGVRRCPKASEFEDSDGVGLGL